MKKIFLLFGLGLLMSCGSSRQLEANEITNEELGYNPSHPILVGSNDLRYGPEYEQNYLNNLSGPNGEVISYTRLGSCCEFATPKGIMGGGMLDKYEIKYEGLEKPIILYLNMYEPAPKEIKVPSGLKLKEN
ncbi:hypothetical protein [Autumnicola musiva]|uniref:2-dehydro-3-deoxyphosphooctonate aldolase n=1 Tax=Autumnicola musiva TaxID=3075589 RepID=A0ABU3D965_9FLAO|nr:hypothetical protein [Zunongwangia sp. F117]MDT0678074.1 hypothetical protein [Zunongwangia sp. F117]